LVYRLEWFSYSRYSSSWKMYLIVIAGFVLSLLLGIYFTESKTTMSRSQEYEYSSSRTGNVFYNYYPIFGNSGTSSGSSSTTSIDIDDGGGEAVAYLVLIIIALALILGSAIIPHFWIVACAVSIGLMGLLTYHELSLNEDEEERYRY
jgi:hypothetical protein